MPAHSFVRRAVAALCTALLLATASTPALAATDMMESQLPEENATSDPVVDALFLRPLGMISLVYGVALFVPTAFFTVITRPTDIGKPVDSLILSPIRYVWVDELGKH